MKNVFFIALILSVTANSQVNARSWCNEVLSSPQTLCGYKIDSLNEVNKVCFWDGVGEEIGPEVGQEEMRLSLQIDDTIVAGTNHQGMSNADGGSRIIRSEMFAYNWIKILTTKGKIFETKDCFFYLNRDYKSYWGNGSGSGKVPQVLKYHLCEGDFLERNNHEEERCRSRN